MAELPIAPGEVYIEVEYDYEYKSKDRLINIRQGDCYMLVKKTNEDWWQVKKEEGTKSFYVPAQYVREVRKALMPPLKPVPHPPAASGNTPPQSRGVLWVRPTNLELGLQNHPAENLLRHESASHPRRSPRVSPLSQRRHSSHRHAPTSPTTLTDHDRALHDVLVHGGGHKPRGSSSTLPRSRARSPDMPRVLLDVDGTQPFDSAEEERRTNDSSGEELSSSSTEHLQTVSSGQGRSESPVYTNLQELKITQTSLPPLPTGSPIHSLGNWETHKDQNGRHFYYHRGTKETTWKPPRAREAGSGNSGGDNHSAGESSEYNLSPPQPSGDAPKSRSLDRRNMEPIVLTKWRHSAYVQEPNDKVGHPDLQSTDLPVAPHDSYSRLLKTRRFRAVSARLHLHPYKPKDAPLGPAPPSPDSDSCPSSPKSPSSPSEKCGVLNVTKITEFGKKVRKSWTSSWTVLQGHTLLFAKEKGGGSSWFGGSQTKPEFTVDLRGGSVEWASKDKSSKKHVVELKTRHGTDLLIQWDTDTIINDWYRVLQETISTHAWESDEAIEEDLPESPGFETGDKEQRDSKKGRAMKNSSIVDTNDNKKTRHKLKKFLTRRPTLQSVRDKGYIKDQVFGCSLSSLCHRENGTVPSFVTTCIDHVETSGLCVDGIYRVSGNLAVIQKLRFAVNHDEKVNLADGKWEDIHVTTGALKMYFRELPEPLFTYSLFHDFVNSIKISDYKQRVHSIKDLVRQLPKPNHDTMQVLFKHLRTVIDHGEENRMTTQSVAIVFGPTLLRPETETWNMAVHMVYQNQIVELILLEYENIFGR
ncbi:rho GTPase-activating protein 12-like isoform X10 [Platichthys flesus]|uniref:rho GTPase-activating protein 12-like isoform X10 n=1 Tax=Platichthys flesus TaxID=8260 RepID=UPI002DBB3969|nr:rho GTPase-activating protein 12-like isoform X10 [Platichthys flesus]